MTFNFVFIPEFTCEMVSSSLPVRHPLISDLYKIKLYVS